MTYVCAQFIYYKLAILQADVYLPRIGLVPHACPMQVGEPILEDVYINTRTFTFKVHFKDDKLRHMYFLLAHYQVITSPRQVNDSLM